MPNSQPTKKREVHRTFGCIYSGLSFVLMRLRILNQLYTATKLRSNKRNRMKSRLIPAAMVLLYGLYQYYLNPAQMGVSVYPIVALLWFFFHPYYSRYRYRKHYETNIEENYKERINTKIGKKSR